MTTMASTDSPLKDLVQTGILDFASWLLGAEAIAALPLDTELAGQAVRVDQLYLVTLADLRTVKLHIEFQGPRSREPMRLRMLEYMTRQVRSDQTATQHSVVFYVGQGAGADDTGEHTIDGPDGKPVLTWRYQVHHLWRMKAEDLLALNRPPLLALIGQTVIDSPAETLPKVLNRIKSVADETVRQRLLADMVALISDQEIISMVEKLIEEEGLLMDTPYLRRLRDQSRQEGWQEGRAEGEQISQRRAVLNVIRWRFNPPILTFQEIEKQIATFTDGETLEILHKMAAQAQTFAEFQTSLNQIIAQRDSNQSEAPQP
jgi:predicted transposase YdaD